MDNLNSTMIIKVTEFIIYKLKKKKKKENIQVQIISVEKPPKFQKIINTSIT